MLTSGGRAVRPWRQQEDNNDSYPPLSYRWECHGLKRSSTCAPIRPALSCGAQSTRLPHDFPIRPRVSSGLIHKGRTMQCARKLKLGMFFLWCCLQAVWTLPLTTTGPIYLRCVALRVLCEWGLKYTERTWWTFSWRSRGSVCTWWRFPGGFCRPVPRLPGTCWPPSPGHLLATPTNQNTNWETQYFWKWQIYNLRFQAKSFLHERILVRGFGRGGRK